MGEEINFKRIENCSKLEAFLEGDVVKFSIKFPNMRDSVELIGRINDLSRSAFGIIYRNGDSIDSRYLIFNDESESLREYNKDYLDSPTGIIVVDPAIGQTIPRSDYKGSIHYPDLDKFLSEVNL
ncbi:MAG: hypothetical protein AABX19_00950 [Nanoarchaeota archaeon]